MNTLADAAWNVFETTPADVLFVLAGLVLGTLIVVELVDVGRQR